MSVEKVEGILCPDCDAFIDKDDMKPQELYQCGECDKVFVDEDEAKECCKE